MDNLKFRKKIGNSGGKGWKFWGKNWKSGGKLKLGKIVNLEKCDNLENWKFGKMEVWKRLGRFENFLEILKIFRCLEIFGNYLEIWAIEYF